MRFQEEETIARAIAETEIQDPFLFRSLYRARLLSDFLIDGKGELVEKPFPPFSDGIEGENDAFVLFHFKRTLEKLFKSRELRRLFNRFTMPVANLYIERLILYSLNSPLNIKVTNRELRRAVLTALLTPLRQNVGSCFATAPAILIQREQLDRLLLDLYDLMMTSRLSRTFGGIQNTVPMSPSWGIGDLRKPISLRNPKIFQAPGIQAALKVIGISNEKVREMALEKNLSSVEGLIETIVCHFYGLKREELKKGFFSNSEEIKQVVSIEREAKDAFKALTDHALLKTWEYTLASFADYKIEFYRWNLYASLGFDPTESGGIGELLYEKLQEKLVESNEKTEKLNQEYMRADYESEMTASLLRQASTYERVRQLKGELNARLHHAQICKDLRDDSHERGEHLAGFFKYLIEQYSGLFPEYFQEVYDAEMFDVKPSLYDDSPAGFRLVYKHGRRDPSTWTVIQTGEEYIQALKSFFLAVETRVSSAYEWKEGEEVLEELTTSLIHYLDEERFLSSAIERMGKAHRVSQKGGALEDIERFQKKPWSYTSGGTMHTLLRCYYCLENDLSEEKVTLENPLHLLVFLLDLMKGLPYKTTRLFEENLEKGMLMFSPTHAFTFLPGLPSFKEGWVDKGFSYTWARDRVITPGEVFYHPIRLERDVQCFLAEKFFTKMLPNYKEELLFAFSPFKQTVSIPEFWEHMKSFFVSELPRSINLLDDLEGFLRTAFPLLRPPDLEKILQEFPASVQERFVDSTAPLYTSYEAYQTLFHLIGAKPNRYLALDQAFEKWAFLPPKPLLFADTNWSRYFFGFGYNPCSETVDLWRLDARSKKGTPLSVWRPFLSGSRSWGVFTSPSEYSGYTLPDFSLLKKKV